MAFPGSFLTDVALGPCASRQAAMDAIAAAIGGNCSIGGVSGFSLRIGRYLSSPVSAGRVAGQRPFCLPQSGKRSAKKCEGRLWQTRPTVRSARQQQD
jgi:hypothetical protein